MNRIRKRLLRYVNRKTRISKTEELIQNNTLGTEQFNANFLHKELNTEKKNVTFEERRSKSASSLVLGELSGPNHVMTIVNSELDKISSNSSDSFTVESREIKVNSEESFISTKENEEDVTTDKFNSVKSVKATELSTINSANDEAIVRRKNLPVPRAAAKFSLLSMMRQVFGKDLSRISMPICLNEPISFIQRISEDLEYHELLSKASKTKSIEERVAYITVFASSALSSTFQRLSKPFNPLLGETFELTHRGFKFIGEQVMHHPPVVAYHSESDSKEWTYWGTVWSIMSFGPNSLTILPQGMVHLKIKTIDGTEEEYYWERPNCVIHNIIFGSTWLEWTGDINVISPNHGYRGKTTFFTDSSNSYNMRMRGISHSTNVNKNLDKRNIVTGSVFNENDQRIFCIEGYSDLEIQISPFGHTNQSYTPYSRGNVIWRCNPHPNNGDNSRNFFLTYMAIELNEITNDYNPSKGANIPITDSRFRPDQRLYESGDIDGAQNIKGILEEKQRKRAKTGTSAKPRWFVKGNKIPSSQYKKIGSVSKDVVDCEWNFNNEYWSFKESQKFSSLTDIVDIFNIDN
ncbi:oxysterol-binding protein 3 [Cryptosporidium ryanae]|uniref:oxysterol-binding protein 3 n=1 Tax=Cryptosporidium ryanae TaxID=515981 RepID=UPI003519F43E|nr:oxysterol-binding protein 3 [Cryptosporidium ryanae]